MSKTISISDQLKNDIDDAATQEGHQTIDSVIRIWKAESEMYRIWKNEIDAYLKRKMATKRKQKKEPDEKKT